MISTNPDLIERCFKFHNQGFGTVRSAAEDGVTGANFRMTEFQAALLRVQIPRLDEQSRKRSENAAYLSGLMDEIPGVSAARMYPGSTRNAYHLFMWRYDKSQFAGMNKGQFLKALSAEGIPVSGGYRRLNEDPLLKNTFATRGSHRIFPAKLLKQWEERNVLPNNNRVCEEACWFTQNMLLADRSAMDQIADAIRKVQRHAGEFAQT